ARGDRAGRAARVQAAARAARFPPGEDPGRRPRRAGAGQAGRQEAMSRVTVFLCRGKDCSRAWRRVCAGSPRKWLKRQVADAGLPYRLRVVETECMDRCDQAACLCVVAGSRACWTQEIRSADDVDAVLAGLRSTIESGLNG